MTKQISCKCALVLVLATCAMAASEKSACAGGYYFHGAAPYYLGPVYAYGYQPYFAAPAPVVGYGYGYLAGPPVWNTEVARPAYYYPEAIGWSAGYYAAYPAKVKYRFHHGYVKVEIDD